MVYIIFVVMSEINLNYEVTECIRRQPIVFVIFGIRCPKSQDPAATILGMSGS